MGKLVLYLPDGTMHDIVLDKERLTIGRRADNDICLPYPAVSAEHAAVVTILTDSFLEDLGSTNGTLVNGQRVTKHLLRDNDLIDIGRHRLVFFMHEGANPDPLPPDVLRREVLELHEQVERARKPRLERKPLAAPGASGPGTEDPLTPDDELMADIEAAQLPGTDWDGPMSRPKALSNSTVASRAAATWVPVGDDAADIAEQERDVQAPAALQQLPAAVAPPPSYRVRVLTGPSAGRELAITQSDVLIGWVGLQVAKVVQSEDGWRLVHVEGGAPVSLNGSPVPADGAVLAPGDRFEVAGAGLTFESG